MLSSRSSLYLTRSFLPRLWREQSTCSFNLMHPRCASTWPTGSRKRVRPRSSPSASLKKRETSTFEARTSNVCIVVPLNMHDETRHLPPSRRSLVFHFDRLFPSWHEYNFFPPRFPRCVFLPTEELSIILRPSSEASFCFSFLIFPLWK